MRGPYGKPEHGTWGRITWSGTATVGDAVVIGVDSSTQSTKALAVDVGDRRRILGEGRAPHTVSTGAERESDRSSGGPRWSRHWSRRASAARAAAVSVGGQQHGLVALDDEGRSVHPALLWNDVRSPRRSAEALVERLGAKTWAERVGSVPGASLHGGEVGLAARARPEAAERTRTCGCRTTILTERLTGERRDRPRRRLRHRLVGVRTATTPRSSGSSAWTRPCCRGWPSPATAAGQVRVEDLPLRAGTLVGTGTGDNMAAALGLGLAPGEPVISLGTSGTVVRRHPRPARPTRAAPSPDSPTLSATGCRWPAPSTARSPSTGSPPCSASTARRSSRAARSSCCPTSTASAPRTCRTPPAC